MDSEKNNWFSRLVSGTYSGVVAYAFFIIIAGLLYLSAVSTSFVNMGERIFFLPDRALTKILAFLLTVLVFMLANRLFTANAFSRRLEEDELFFKKVRRAVLVAVWILLSVWAVCTQIYPRADQKDMFDVARALGEKDFSAYSDVNYLYTFNHQIGLGMAMLLLNKVVGEYNFVAYHLILAALVPLIYLELSLIGGYFGLKQRGQLAVIILCILFAPLALYASFIYGTIPGLLLALLAVRLELKYFRDGTWRDALLSALSIALSAMLKSNYLIFMVAMLIYAVVKLINGGKIKKCLILAFIALFYLAQAKIPISVFAEMREAGIPTGVSKWVWVTMGLQDGTNPGWYSGYTVDTLKGSDFDTHTQEIWVKEDLRNRIDEFIEDFDMARDFFVRKTASQWNEPSFEAMFILQGNKIGSEAKWPEKLITEQGSYTLTNCLNYLHFIILAGTLLYMLLCSKSEHYFDSLILPMIFIGGFLFHLVWEAKGQYTLPYFVLLLPYTVMGYSASAKAIVRAGAAVKNGSAALTIDKKTLALNLLLFALAVLILWYLFHGTLGSITGDSEAYYAYLAAHS